VYGFPQCGIEIMRISGNFGLVNYFEIEAGGRSPLLPVGEIQCPLHIH